MKQTLKFLLLISIAAGSYGYLDNTPIPATDIQTIATMALLVAREDENPALIRSCLEILHQERMRIKHPALMSREEIRNHLEDVHFHRTSRAFYDPFDPGKFATYVEAVAGTKDLLFAMGAGLFLLWRLRKRYSDKIRKRNLAKQQIRLREFLDATIQLESRQIGLRNTKQLIAIQEQVTRVKINALDELSHEGIHGDRTFSIFLMQCANLINKIQLKIIELHHENTSDTP